MIVSVRVPTRATTMSWLVVGLMLWMTASVLLVASQPGAPNELVKPEKVSRADLMSDAPDTAAQVQELVHAALRLPLAAGLASILAFRPRRRGTPARKPPVIQTQIILAVIGALVMLVVGSSLARAFGIVGAAGLVRYRAKIDDPKDAGVMLSTLAVGLASGVGLWLLAAFGTVFLLGLIWLLESAEPSAMLLFGLKVKAKDPNRLKERLEYLLRSQQATFELRGVAQEEVQYDVQWPVERETSHLSETILALDPGNATEVEWEPKSAKK